MPLTKRSISPINLSLHRLPQNVRENELECVANGTLANLVRQLSSLSKHAEDIFGELYREAVKIEHKTSTFFNRIDRIASKVTQLDSTVEEVSLQDLHLRKPFKSSTLIDQQSLSRQTMPAAMADCYAYCDKPPELDKLNPYRTDGKAALKFYTDPDYFFELWRQEMLKDGDHVKRAKNVNRPKSGSGEKKHKSKRHHTRENRQRHLIDQQYHQQQLQLRSSVANVAPEAIYAAQQQAHQQPQTVLPMANGRISTNQQQQNFVHSVNRESLDETTIYQKSIVNNENSASQYAHMAMLKQNQAYFNNENSNNSNNSTGYGSLASNNTISNVNHTGAAGQTGNYRSLSISGNQDLSKMQQQQQYGQHYDYSKYSILSKNQLYGAAGVQQQFGYNLDDDTFPLQNASNITTPVYNNANSNESSSLVGSVGGAFGAGQMSPESVGGVSSSSEGAASSSQSKSTSSGGAGGCSRPSQPPPAPPPPPPPPPPPSTNQIQASSGQHQQAPPTGISTNNINLPLTDPLKGQFKRLQMVDTLDGCYTEVVKKGQGQAQRRDRTLSPPEAPIVYQTRRHERSASPDLPPPPPPIYADGRSASPPSSSSNTAPVQAPPPPPPPPPLLTNGLPTSTKKSPDKKPTAPAPPPPTGAPPNAVQSNFSQGGGASLLKSPSSQSASSKTNPTGGAGFDGRSDLLKAIRDGIQLKKVNRKQEKEQEDVAISKGHDVAAILRKRMEDVMGRSESEESASDFEDDWDD